MLQDIAPHIYRNQMSWKAPDADDFVLCYRGRTLYCKVEDRNLILPRVKDVAADALQYAFSIDERADYLLSDAEFEPQNLPGGHRCDSRRRPAGAHALQGPPLQALCARRRI